MAHRRHGKAVLDGERTDLHRCKKFLIHPVTLLFVVFSQPLCVLTAFAVNAKTWAELLHIFYYKKILPSSGSVHYQRNHITCQQSFYTMPLTSSKIPFSSFLSSRTMTDIFHGRESERLIIRRPSVLISSQ